ncbi:MAG: hypothetical protein ACRD88_13790 [Terriglobia bacterium]
MKRYICSSLIVSLFAFGSVISTAQAQNIIRKSAEFLYFTPGATGTEATSIAVNGPLGTGGTSVYTKTIFTGPGENILYVTMSATGDAHGGVKQRFACLVDGVPCNPGGGGINLANTGWVTLLKLPQSPTTTNCNDGGGGTADCHDNSIHYQWCKVIPRIVNAAGVETGGPRTVNVRMATEVADTPVFIEQTHFYIDATKGGTPTCTEGTP